MDLWPMHNYIHRTETANEKIKVTHDCTEDSPNITI